MKIRKKRKKETIYKNNIKKAWLMLIMLISIIIAMITYWIYAYHHKYGEINFDNIKLISYKISDYVEVEGDIIKLKNIDESITNDFTVKQKNILNNNNVLNVDITNNLHKNILSIMINYTISKNTNNYEEIITLNVDLKKDKVLTNEELLSIVSSNYKQIAKDIFEENIKLPSDSNEIVMDAINDKTLTANEFNKDSEKYIIRIREKLPDVIKLYIKDEKLNYIVNLSEIEKVCYYTNNKLVNINKEIGKI